MLSINDLSRRIWNIDGRGYRDYRQLEGEYDAGRYRLYIDHVQSDPFAPPSKIRLRVERKEAGFPEYLFTGKRVLALEDVLARIMRSRINEISRRVRGTGKSGLIYIDAGQQQVIKRTACMINDRFIEFRLSVGLPAAGRRIIAAEAEELMCSVLPAIAEATLFFECLNEKDLRERVFLYEDQELIRAGVAEKDLAAFVGNGAILPRLSGNSDLPLTENQAVKFQSPPELEVEFPTLHHGTIRGMGIANGVSLIVGGGYHGKSTLLRAIERGVYNHVPGDGREWVITRADAVKIRAEDGRGVQKVNIRYFIDNLPFGEDTSAFSTSNASGSTSQAANIVEAIEGGARLLLLDEDTSATNFMIRDARMQRLVTDDKEPITPFIDRVRPLYEKVGVSTLLVVGGAGDYLDVADRVIILDHYQVYDVTEKARQVSQEIQSLRRISRAEEYPEEKPRIVDRKTFNHGEDRFKITARDLSKISYGREDIDLSAVEQLVDPSQTRTITECLRCLERYVDGKRSLKEILAAVIENLEENLSLHAGGKHPGDLAMPRRHELYAALNRMRSLKIL